MNDQPERLFATQNICGSIINGDPSLLPHAQKMKERAKRIHSEREIMRQRAQHLRSEQERKVQAAAAAAPELAAETDRNRASTAPEVGVCSTKVDRNGKSGLSDVSEHYGRERASTAPSSKDTTPQRSKAARGSSDSQHPVDLKSVLAHATLSNKGSPRLDAWGKGAKSDLRTDAGVRTYGRTTSGAGAINESSGREQLTKAKKADEQTSSKRGNVSLSGQSSPAQSSTASSSILDEAGLVHRSSLSPLRSLKGLDGELEGEISVQEVSEHLAEAEDSYNDSGLDRFEDEEIEELDANNEVSLVEYFDNVDAVQMKGKGNGSRANHAQFSAADEVQESATLDLRPPLESPHSSGKHHSHDIDTNRDLISVQKWLGLEGNSTMGSLKDIIGNDLAYFKIMCGRVSGTSEFLRVIHTSSFTTQFPQLVHEYTDDLSSGEDLCAKADGALGLLLGVFKCANIVAHEISESMSDAMTSQDRLEAMLSLNTCLYSCLPHLVSFTTAIYQLTYDRLFDSIVRCFRTSSSSSSSSSYFLTTSDMSDQLAINSSLSAWWAVLIESIRYS